MADDNTKSALAYATNLLGSLPSLIAGGVQVITLIEAGLAKLKQFTLEKRNPTDLEWDELNSDIAAKRAELHS